MKILLIQHIIQDCLFVSLPFFLLVLTLEDSLAEENCIATGNGIIDTSSCQNDDINYPSSKNVHAIPTTEKEQDSVSQTDQYSMDGGYDSLNCDVYMAPSTLGNASNLGIFTAKPLNKGDTINYPEIIIPLGFREWGISRKQGDGELWDRYLWDGSVGNIEVFNTYDHHDRKAVFIPGVGCTVNSILDLSNVAFASVPNMHESYTEKDQPYYNAMVERGNPAAGSFSPYHNSVTKVTANDIPAGAELMANYGESWIPSIPNIPVLQDAYMDESDALLDEFEKWNKEIQNKYGNEVVSTGLVDRVYQTIRKFPVPSKVLSVLPSERIITNELSTSSVTRDNWRSHYQVDLQWLRQNGKCQDHMRPGRSTIKNAGQGAFAARFLPQGTTVGYAPLIHVAYVFDELTTVPDGQGGSHPDLIWNYSFGHKNTTLTLTPYGGMVNYINHAPKPEQVNVRVNWPKDSEFLLAHKPEWLEKDLNFLAHATAGIGLSFEYTALRDIEEGEEIFLDYGDEWDRTWNEHVQKYQSPDDAETYRHSTNFTLKDNRLKTPAERRVDPYPPNLITICTKSFRRQGDRYVFLPVLRDWKEYVPCEVKDRTRGGKYVVKLMLDATRTSNSITVYNVPSPEGIRLVDRAYTQDWHLPQAFRYKIQIPDDLLPSAWMNL